MGRVAMSRRRFLIGSVGLSSVGIATVSSCGASTKRRAKAATIVRHAYGADASQFGDLYRPGGPEQPGVVVVIHGGFWLAQYDLTLGAPLATDLVERGYTVFNVEYRRIGNDGGWPSTLLDVAAGIDLLASIDVDTSRVAVIGHSAGGQLAAWAAGRARLAAGTPGSAPKVTVTAVVSQAGVLDLATAARQGVGGSAVPDFVGGLPDQVPQRYAIADPIAQVPLVAPTLCVHGRSDLNVPFAQSSAYVAAAKAAAANATLVEVPGDHFALIDPTSVAWKTVVEALPGLLA
jgi:acetyl esterase/lipase